MAKKKAAPKKKKPVHKPVAKKKAAPKKKAARRLSLTAGSNTMTVTISFSLGGGKIDATLSRNGTEIETKTNRNGGDIIFDDVRSGDELGINGACSGNATLTTDRSTTPASGSSSPRKYKKNIFDSLGIN